MHLVAQAAIVEPAGDFQDRTTPGRLPIARPGESRWEIFRTEPPPGRLPHRSPQGEPVVNIRDRTTPKETSYRSLGRAGGEFSRPNHPPRRLPVADPGESRQGIFKTKTLRGGFPSLARGEPVGNFQEQTTPGSLPNAHPGAFDFSLQLTRWKFEQRLGEQGDQFLRWKRP